METVNICGFAVGRLTMSQVVDLLVSRARSGKGGWVALMNLEMLARAKRDPDYMQLLLKSDMVFADGMPLVWASKKIGLPLPERIPGVDLAKELLSDAYGLRISIIGGENPALALNKAGVANRERFQIHTARVEPSHQGVEEISRLLSEHGPQVVFLALGVGKQDVLAEKLKRRHPNAVFLGVGGSFEMIGGMKKRAPKGMQRAGMEWLFRLMIEPRRLWKRYLVNYPPGALWLIKCAREERRRLRRASTESQV